MFNISSYLEKFKNIGLKELLFKEEVARILNEKLKTTFEAKDIGFKNAVVNIKAVPGVKSELFLKKSLILEELKKRQPGIIVKDIR